VSELRDLYLEIGVKHKKALTIDGNRCRIERHLKPLLGTKRVSDVTLADVERAMKDIADGKTRTDPRTGKLRARIMVRGGRGAATRIIGLLGGIFSFAQRQGFRTDNPCHGVRRYRVNDCLRLQDSKTGAKIIPIGGAALQLLAGLPRLLSSPFVFPASVGRGHFIGVKSTWDRVRHEADFPKLRLRDLRHSFASIAIAEGDILPMIGALLGHSNPRTTARYAHLEDSPKRQAAQRISGRIADAMGFAQTS
jgi:integrase